MAVLGCRRLHNVVQQGGELFDAVRVREQPHSWDARDPGQEGEEVVAGQAPGGGEPLEGQVEAPLQPSSDQQDHHSHRRGIAIVRSNIITTGRICFRLAIFLTNRQQI